MEWLNSLGDKKAHDLYLALKLKISTMKKQSLNIFHYDLIQYDPNIKHYTKKLSEAT